ncbi:MAG: APC family permease [Deltaproteobacteria bacterium]|jgi:amino acid transporter|nr:APC family permease [Deltaproteobacteria bacterium]
MDRNGSLNYWSVVAIGVGGMVGGGIFAVLGLAVQLAHGGTPIAFTVAGLVALVTSYSYAQLSVRYPSQGGSVEFINQAFGPGILAGALNVLLWLSYIVMLCLYSYAFGSYAASFFPEGSQFLWKHISLSAAVVLLTFLNIQGADIVGKAEEWIVGTKVVILLFFVGIGIWSVQLHRLAPSRWSSPLELVAGGMIIFLAYEGFELIANTSGEVKNPGKILPLSYYSAVLFVIILYGLISLVTVGNLSVSAIVQARDYALAESARPFLGSFGFVLIAVAALLSTSSAINATLYGAARTSYIIAKEGELPEILEKKVWHHPIEGLLITAAATLVLANSLDLSSISMMGSAGFLLIFAAVNGSNVILSRETASRMWISALGVVVCMAALGALLWHTAQTAPAKLWVLLVMIVIALGTEIIYRSVSGREIRKPLQKGLG